MNQVLVASSYAAVAEAIALGQQLELPMQQVIDALKAALRAPGPQPRSGAMLQGYPLGFKLSLHHKDLGIALEAANGVDIDLPITALVEQLESDLIRRGYGDDDVSAASLEHSKPRGLKAAHHPHPLGCRHHAIRCTNIKAQVCEPGACGHARLNKPPPPSGPREGWDAADPRALGEVDQPCSHQRLTQSSSTIRSMSFDCR